MKIYTKTGDRGQTGLIGGARVSKAHIRVTAYGAVDETNAVLGVVRSLHPPRPMDRLLAAIQQDLFRLGADLATPPMARRRGVATAEIGADDVARLERWIDAAQARLMPLRRFILPGGSPLAAHLHQARAVCRRAERAVVALAEREPIGAQVVPYLNRLGDYLFVLARLANRRARVREAEWEGRKPSG